MRRVGIVRSESERVHWFGLARSSSVFLSLPLCLACRGPKYMKGLRKTTWLTSGQVGGARREGRRDDSSEARDRRYGP